MAKAEAKEKAKVRRQIPTENIALEQGEEIPPIARGSKYPWETLTTDSGLSFFVPMESLEAARKARISIQASGRNFYTRRGFPFRAVCRVVSSNGRVGVRAWALTT